MKNEEIIIERFNIDNYAEYVINIAYPNSKISLKADGDGLYFWDKLGVESVKNNDSVKILKGENRNA